MNLDYKEGLKIAQDFDVSTKEDCAVVYSVSYLASIENKHKAYAYVKSHKICKTIDDTPCGKSLCEKGFQCTNDEATSDVKEIWQIASRRFVLSASGNLTAFVDGADMRSTFCSVEIPEILKNEKITTINGIDKCVFLRQFQK